jgi:hypothetical protein
MQHESRNGTIDTATHCYQDFSFTAHNKKFRTANLHQKARTGNVAFPTFASRLPTAAVAAPQIID